MIPQNIRNYLGSQNVAFELISHPRAVSAQKLAQSLHVSGYSVVKAVIVKAGEQRYIVVLPAAESVDPVLLGGVLGASHVELCGEEQLQSMFSDCELGAEPPFGRLYGLPVVMDASLLQQDALLMRAGSHNEALKLRRKDFLRLEQPRVGAFAVHPQPSAQGEAHA
jgi:Ala-tRNA(Pro) deacylase